MFEIQYAKNLQWSSDEKISFACLVKYAEFEEEHPTGVSPHDPNAHIQTLWANGLVGEYGPIAEYEKSPQEFPQAISTGGDTPTQPTSSGMQTL